MLKECFSVKISNDGLFFFSRFPILCVCLLWVVVFAFPVFCWNLSCKFSNVLA